jgi:hypothetical protein
MDNMGTVGSQSTTYRIINVFVWLYLWLSDVMNPVVTEADFWSEKARQLLRLNQHFDDPPRLLGNAVIPLVLWFAIDLWPRRKPKRVDPPAKDNWTNADKETFKSLMERRDRSENK